MAVHRPATSEEYNSLQQRVGLPIHRFWNNYAVTPDGKVWRLTRRGWREKVQMCRDGYFYVRRFTGGRERPVSESYKVSRLVCEAFNGPAPFPGALVRHLNDVKADNRAENLAWGSVRDNFWDSVRNGTTDLAERAERLRRARCTQPRRRLTGEQALQIRDRFVSGQARARDLAREYSISKKHVYRLAKGEHIPIAALTKAAGR